MIPTSLYCKLIIIVVVTLSLRMKPGRKRFFSSLSVTCYSLLIGTIIILILCSFFYVLKENCPNLRELNVTGTNIRTFHIEKLQVGSQLCRII